MTNIEVAWLISEMADLLELQGAEAFKVRAYRRAAQSVENLPVDIAGVAASGRLEEIPGIGRNLSAKIQEILSTGTCSLLERLRAEVPRTLLDFLAIPGVGARTAALVHRELGIKTIDELEAAARAGKLRDLPGMGGKKEQNIITGIEALRARNGRCPLGVALPLAADFARFLERHPAVKQVAVAGSLRRHRDTVADIDLVAASDRPGEVMDAFVSLPMVRDVLARGETKSTIVTRLGLQADLRVVAPDEFWTALHHSTGSKEHHVRLRGRARDRGLKINEYGVFREDGEKIPVAGEEELYRLLDLEYIPPELREDRGEVEAAAEGRLPDLVSLADIRGDLHIHSDWSDGTSAIAELALAARARGYEYIAITDHSRSLAMARGLDEARLKQQQEAIAAVNRELDGIEVLAGIEVDILRNGTLDLPDGVLADLDVVIASVHTGFRQEEAVITERVLGALKNEHVDILAHPTGRLLGRRSAYALDIDQVLEAAAANGTCLEINASPDRLDLDDVNARRAKDLGIRLAINTDAHAVPVLDDMTFGVDVARRAWLERKDVLNALPLADLRRVLRR